MSSNEVCTEPVEPGKSSAKRSDGLALTAFISSFFALLCWIGLPIALLCGILAIKRNNFEKASRKSLAIASLVIAPVLAVLVAVGVMLMPQPTPEEKAAKAAAEASQQAAAQASEKAAAEAEASQQAAAQASQDAAAKAEAAKAAAAEASASAAASAQAAKEADAELYRSNPLVWIGKACTDLDNKLLKGDGGKNPNGLHGWSSYIEVQDGGKNLEINAPLTAAYDDEAGQMVENFRLTSALGCVLDYLQTSKPLRFEIEGTSAMSGQKTATEGGFTYRWYYSGNSGLGMLVTRD